MADLADTTVFSSQAALVPMDGPFANEQGPTVAFPSTIAAQGGSTADAGPPTFAGLTALDAPTVTSLTAHWLPAADDQTPENKIVYELHVSTAAGSLFNARAISNPGATSHVIADLLPGTTYFVRARARDLASNLTSSAGTELSAATLATGPVFGGLVSAAAVSTTSVTLAWTAASDDYTPPDKLVYELHWSESPAAAFVTRGLSAPGASTFLATGLRPGVRYYFRARARDAQGLTSGEGLERSVQLAAGAPTVTNITPAPGSVRSANDAIQFDVTDDSGAFRRIFVTCAFALSGVTEAVHDGTSFVGLYAAGSSRQAIALGYRYTVVRAGGWTSSMTWRVYPIDQSGTEA